MAAGLSAFGRYRPVDVVAMLANEGIRAEPGGTDRLVTVLTDEAARARPGMDFELRLVDRASLRGRAGTVDVFEVTAEAPAP